MEQPAWLKDLLVQKSDSPLILQNHVAALAQAVGVLYWSQQQKEATKTAATTFPRSINVQVPTVGGVVRVEPIQIMPDNSRRDELSIVNVGPSDIYYANKWFDPNSINQQMTEPNLAITPAPAVNPVGFNQMVDVGILLVGGSVTLRTSSPIWVYNVNATATSAAGRNALLSVVETVFDTADGFLNGTRNPAVGEDGAEWNQRDLMTVAFPDPLTDGDSDSLGTLNTETPQPATLQFNQ